MTLYRFTLSTVFTVLLINGITFYFLDPEGFQSGIILSLLAGGMAIRIYYTFSGGTRSCCSTPVKNKGFIARFKEKL
ncbi:MAG: hypothetical protein L6Q77_13800 [Bacteroidetes bacterium]|nr:hypothetical protein [Bacteroidota bacterium]